MEPTLTVLLYSSLAAGTAALGAVPFAIRGRLPIARIGWANALAAGMMLGAAYALMVAIPDDALVFRAAGAALGILFVSGVHAASRVADLDLNRVDETGPEYGYQVLLVNTLHSAAEGIAIGAAVFVSIPFGAFMAVAIAVHNIPEGTVLCAILTGRGVRPLHAGALAVATNVSQVLLAVVTFAVIAAAPGVLPWALGFAVGALVYLVMAELLPESYQQAGSTTIALVAIAAMGVVVLLRGGRRLTVDPVLVVFLYGSITALATGLGALPFVFLRTVSPQVTAYANAIAAAGLMLGASFGLVAEGTEFGATQTLIGATVGVAFILVTQRVLGHHDIEFGKARGAGARRMLLMVVVMTVHSFSEGVAVGVSFGGGATLALVITAAIAVHNIPEGLAISAVMRPRGTSIVGCAGWSIFSSLPQPLMAVPAFLFVETFSVALPYGIGFAAGAMVFMVLVELLPEAYGQARKKIVALLVSLTLVGMVLFQQAL